MSLKTRLLIPPKYELSFPPLGTPVLLGMLKKHGKDADQFDANQEYAKHWLSKVEVTPKSDHPGLRFFTLRALLNDIFLQKKNAELYYSEALENPFTNAAYHDWTDSSYHFTENLLESSYLERFLGDEEENTYLQYYRAVRFGERLEQDGIKLLGISLIGPSQIIPTLTLAKYLKEHFKNSPKILIGGQWATLYHEQIMKRNDLAQWIDYVIRGEGESPTVHLVEHLEGSRKMEHCSNLSYVKNGQWITTEIHTKEDMREMPAPDFDGLSLDEYANFTMKKIGLTYETSRECYWNRCTYCVDLPIPHEGYRVKRVPQVVDEIQMLIKRYKADYIIFSDPAMAPARLRDISQDMVNRGIHIPFWCFGRLEKNFTPEIFQIAKQAGCDEIDFGMETANQRLMDFVDKGTKVAEISKTIRDCAEAGIHVTLQTILRFPTETYDEGLETVNFLIDHKEFIHDVAFNIYYLTPGNHMFNDPERFGLKLRPNQPSFRFFHEWDQLDPKAMSYEDAHQLRELHELLSHKVSRRLETKKNSPEDVVQLTQEYFDEIVGDYDASLSLGKFKATTSALLLKDGTSMTFGKDSQRNLIRNAFKTHSIANIGTAACP